MLGTNYTIFRILKHLSIKCKKGIILNLFIMLASSFAELLTLNSLLPFLGVLTDDSNLLKYPISIFLSKLLKTDQSQELLIPIMIFFGCSIVLSTLIRFLNIWIISLISEMIITEISVKAYSNIIYQPYEYFTKNNSSNFIAVLFKSVVDTSNLIKNSINQISNLILSIFLSISIIIINGKVALYALILFASIYLIIGKIFKTKVSKNSKQIFITNRLLVKSSQEVLGSIKNIILNSNQEILLKRFRFLTNIKNKLDAKNTFFGSFPRFLLEGLALLSVVIISFFIINSRSTSGFVVQLGAFVLGIQKLLPAIQKVYATWIANKSLSADVKQMISILEIKNNSQKNFNIKPHSFQKSIKFDSVSFAYEDINNSVISDFNLEIFKGQRLGIIGKTGSGKTTITDLMMGLLEPSNGRILVDNININDINKPGKLIEWRLSISHVPQSIFLSDSSIAENIAFGLEKNLISMSAVIQASKKAQLHDFVESKSEGYNTIIGERGIKLSGGQRQRIGIARALYKKAEILILDEATSALDNETEIEVINSLKSLNEELTIISIAHRKSTLQNCDRVIEIKKGKIVEDMNHKTFKDKYLL